MNASAIDKIKNNKLKNKDKVFDQNKQFYKNQEKEKKDNYDFEKEVMDYEKNDGKEYQNQVVDTEADQEDNDNKQIMHKQQSD